MASALGDASPSRWQVLANAVRDALGTAALALGLAVPILALRTEQNISNELILQPRWGYVAVAVLGAFAARLAYLLIAAAGPARERRKLTIPSGWRDALGRSFAGIGLACLVLYPLIALSLTGKAGAIKWIDNFGIQIMIYIMLGWGLNIVVGLAGLLDLGYVAFYAVGAYSSALLAQNFGLSFWLCLPLAGILAAFWGVLLGFPVLRLRGDYLAIVTWPSARSSASSSSTGFLSPAVMPASPAYRGRRCSAFPSTPARRVLPPSSTSSSRRCTGRSFCFTSSWCWRC